MLATVTVAFIAAGDVSDYDHSARSSIKVLFARTAAVPSENVDLSITAASVEVTAIIRVADVQTATAVAEALTAGPLADVDTLQAALSAAGAPITVAAITAIPTVTATGSEN